jgi:hypothetical protein
MIDVWNCLASGISGSLYYHRAESDVLMRGGSAVACLVYRARNMANEGPPSRDWRRTAALQQPRALLHRAGWSLCRTKVRLPRKAVQTNPSRLQLHATKGGR